MSLKVGETFSGFKMQRPAQCVLRTQSPLLFMSYLEAFSRTGYNISNARKLQFCKQPFEIIQGQIAFKNTVQCINKQTFVLLLHP